MDNSAEKFFKPIKEYWEKLEKKRKYTYIISAAVILVVIISAVLLLNRTEYTVLYTGLEASEAGEIMTKLAELDVEAKAEGTGTILVPEKQETTLRMELAAQGYPATGLNYDLFKSGTGFGTTDYEKQKYMQFQLQDRLQNSIKSLEAIDDAIVTLHIPDSTAYVLKADKQSASASIILRIKNGQSLSQGQVTGIVGLVAKSVPGLEEDQVLIVDGNGNVLSRNSSAQAEVASNQLDMETKVSDEYKKEINSMLEPVFGIGNVITGVRVSLDFDKKTTETTTYEPIEGTTEGIPVSKNESKEVATNSQTASAAGLDANGGTVQYPEDTATTGGEYKKTDKTINYEINSVKELLQKSEGTISDISVSVILDSEGLQSDAEEKVKQIVAGATGINPEKVVVQTMQFDSKSAIENVFDSNVEAAQSLAKKNSVRNMIIYAALALIICLIIFVIIRINSKKRARQELEEAFVEGLTVTENEEEVEDLTFSEKKSDKRRLIEKNIAENPEFIVQLLRNWLDEDGR